MRLFQRPKVREVATTKPLLPISKDALISLGVHPGFRYLIQKLDASRGYLKERMVREQFSNVGQVSRMQGFLEGLDWMEKMLFSEIQGAEDGRQNLRDASDEEMEVFNSLDEFVVEVGKR